MSNILQELLHVVKGKTTYKIGKVVSSFNNFFIVDILGGQLQVSGVGYKVGQTVLVEDDKIIGVVNKHINRVWVD